jgi:hypothetical protein
VGHRHGRRTRTLTGTFGKTEIAVPRARLVMTHSKTTEWKSKALRAYQRRTLAQLGRLGRSTGKFREAQPQKRESNQRRPPAKRL